MAKRLTLFTPYHLVLPVGLSLLSLAVLIILAEGCLIWLWAAGKSIGPAIAGFYQVTDGLGYWTCANALLDLGKFGQEASGYTQWCQRHAIYPTLLSPLVWLAHRNLLLTLSLQTLLTTLAIFIGLRRCAAYSGVFGLIIGAGLLLFYALLETATVTMSESAGLLFGCTAFALLLKAAERPSLPLVMSGLAMLSIALNARAGAFFILPVLLVWSGYVARQQKQNLWLWLGGALFALIVGFVVQAVLVLAVHGNLQNTHGSFAHTLYGLSLGGKGWQQVLNDHPELTQSGAALTQRIYQLATDNIRANPGQLILGLYKNLQLFLEQGSLGYPRLGWLAWLIQASWWIGWIPLLQNRKDPAYLLIGLSSVGIILSAPFLSGDGGPRVFAASVLVDVLQIMLGITWLGVALLQRQWRVRLSASTVLPGSSVSLETGVVLFLLLLLVLPHTLLPRATVTAFTSAGCGPAGWGVVTAIGDGGSLILERIPDTEEADLGLGQINASRLHDGIPPNRWWQDTVLSADFYRDMIRLDYSTFFKTTIRPSLLTAYQLDPSDPNAPGPYYAYTDTSLAPYHGKLVRLCLDRHDRNYLFYQYYHKILSIIVLDTLP